MSSTVQVDCGKCGGAGYVRAFSHIRGGVCFACNGVGHFTRTRASIQRSRKLAGQKRANTAKRVQAANARADAREEHYRADPRIGPDTRARCEKFPAFAFQCYSLLAKIDAGELTEATHPWIFRNLAA